MDYTRANAWIECLESDIQKLLDSDANDMEKLYVLEVVCQFIEVQKGAIEEKIK